MDKTSEKLGLLLYQGGKVCDSHHSFNIKSANAICKDMGYAKATGWHVGVGWDVQHEFGTKIGFVQCETDEWSTCSYDIFDYCGNQYDVFLSCETSGYEPDICYY